MSWETEGMEGYATKWFAENGYDAKVLKRRASKIIYELKKDGYIQEYEIPLAVSNPQKYMEFINQYWDLLKRVEGAKKDA